MPRPPYLAHLRVLVPLDELPVRQRERWSAYVVTAPDRHEVDARQFEQVVRRLAGRPPLAVPAVESTDGLVVRVEGRTFVCPEQPRLRAWHALRPDGASRALAVSVPQVPVRGVPGVPVPDAVRDQAAADLASYVERGGDVRLFSRTATWHVPVAWFVLFGPDERELNLDDGERSLRYLTAMSSARRRCAIALRTARRHLADLPVVAEIEQLGRWLEEFHPHCLVELDYGGLVDLVDDVRLAGDDSVADVAAGLEALADGDDVTAAAAYRRLSSRWTRVQLMARAS